MHCYTKSTASIEETKFWIPREARNRCHLSTGRYMDSVPLSVSFSFSHLRKPREWPKGSKTQPAKLCWVTQFGSTGSESYPPHKQPNCVSHPIRFEKKWLGGARIAATMGTTLGRARTAGSSFLGSGWLTGRSGRAPAWAIWATTPGRVRVSTRPVRTLRVRRERPRTMVPPPTVTPPRTSCPVLPRPAVKERKV